MSFPRRRESRPTNFRVPASAGMTDKSGADMRHFHNPMVPLASGVLDCSEKVVFIEQALTA